MQKGDRPPLYRPRPRRFAPKGTTRRRRRRLHSRSRGSTILGRRWERLSRGPLRRRRGAPHRPRPRRRSLPRALRRTTPRDPAPLPLRRTGNNHMAVAVTVVARTDPRPLPVVAAAVGAVADTARAAVAGPATCSYRGACGCGRRSWPLRRSGGPSYTPSHSAGEAALRLSQQQPQQQQR